jgi:hypothetical protein
MRSPSLTAALVATLVAHATIPLVALAQASTQISAPDAAPVPDMYARYVAPSQCITGQGRMTAFFWRDKRQDTARFAPLTDSVPRFTRDSLRLCVAHFTIATVPDAQVLPMLDLGLALGDDVLIHAATARAEKIIKALPPARRPWMTEQLVLSFLHASPSRLTEARHYLHTLDEMGKTAAYERFSTHYVTASLAFTAGEVTMADTETKASLRAFSELGHAEQINLADTLLRAYAVRTEVLKLTRNRDAVLAMLDSAKNTVMPLEENGGPWANYQKANAAGYLATLRRQVNGLGVKAATLHAERWYGPSGDTVFPKPGRVTLVIMSHPAALSFPVIATIRRLHDEYAPQGLDVVLSTFTTGWFRTTVTPKPTEEMDDFQQWFMDFLHLPIAVAAEESQFGRLPDGRRQNEPGPNLKAYSFGPNAVLVGKDGKIRVVLNVMGEYEQVYRQQIAAALRE